MKREKELDFRRLSAQRCALFLFVCLLANIDGDGVSRGGRVRTSSPTTAEMHNLLGVYTVSRQIFISQHNMEPQRDK